MVIVLFYLLSIVLFLIDLDAFALCIGCNI